MRSLSLTQVLLVAFFGACDARSGPEQETRDRSAEVPLELMGSDLAKAYPFHRYGSDLYLAGLPDEGDFRAMAAAGVRTICDLCDTGERGDSDPEPALVESLGMSFVHCPMGGRTGLGDEVFDEGRRILREAERPLVMHCQSSNRVGAVFLTWCVLDEGLDQEAALRLARRSGLTSSGLESRALDYIAARLDR